MLELPCWTQTVKKASKRLYFLRECMKANLPTEISIRIYYCTRKRPLLEYASPLWGGLPKHLAEELQSLQNRCVDIIRIPRTSLPMLEDRCNIATKRELERVVNYINHPNQIFLTKPNTSHGYNLRSKPGSLSSNTTVRDAKTCKFIYSKSCKTSLMTCYVYLLTYLPTFLLE